MDKMEIAIKVSEMVEDGWTFRSLILGETKMIAEHKEGGGYKFFSNEEELVKWLKS